MKLSYERTFNLGNYENHKIGLYDVEVEDVGPDRPLTNAALLARAFADTLERIQYMHEFAKGAKFSPCPACGLAAIGGRLHPKCEAGLTPEQREALTQGAQEQTKSG